MPGMTRFHLIPLIMSLSFALTFITTVNADRYKPLDAILLNCGGSSDGTDEDKRKWVSDTNAKVLAASVKSTIATSEFQDPSIPSPIPYMTARVFTTPASYNIPVNKKDRHWVRLYFYPTTYVGILPDSAYFSVSASGGVTLLSNFSAYVTAKALSQAYIIKEYSLPPSDDGMISLTFTPSDKYNGSCAFINGIEVISMPEILDDPATLVGFSDQTMDVSGSVFQTMYRLNVGGQFIPPVNDSGMARTWYDDSIYVYGAMTGVTNQGTERFDIEYPDKKAEVAGPADVYDTTRTMGPDTNINKITNLTWLFQVDGNFTYALRLHFCELIHTKVNQRVFDIIINNKTAYQAADVIAWSSGKGVPVYKDFAIHLADMPGDDDLWLALHPNAEMEPEFFDALLNGLEIFKVSDAAGNLAGPNPQPSKMLLDAEASLINGQFKSENTTSNKVIIGAGGFAAAAVVVAFVVGFSTIKKNRTMRNKNGSGYWLPLYSGMSVTTSVSQSTVSGKSSMGSKMSAICRHFAVADIKHATKNFDESLVIGVGGFGKVYKGVVDGSTKVAIKRSNPQSEQGVNEFQTEIEMLSKLRHKHLVSLIGFCEEDGEMCLVYDYMAYGTLREHLYKTNNPPIDWNKRLEISIGSATGLHYLHTGAQYTIIHRDVKTTNILLDENWVAKVSDFGLSKTGPALNNQAHFSTVVKGSFGYLDPEYYKRQQLTEKSDVYSFGVVLFELLCAKPALNPLPPMKKNLAELAMECIRTGTLNDIIDPVIKDQIAPECLAKFVETAKKCVLEHGADRLNMAQVLHNLVDALKKQKDFEMQIPNN